MSRILRLLLAFGLVGSWAVCGRSEPRFARQVGTALSSTATPFAEGKRPLYMASPNGRNPVQGPIEEKFQVNKNSIIRTHDSRALGAKYLNETDLTSNEDCLRWCWNTTNCNLAVFEEKTRGSCYLFDCGALDEFKCRFTGHSFYTSSVLQVSRNSFLLSEWKTQANQESELTVLKDKQQAPKPIDTSIYFKNIGNDNLIKSPLTTMSTKVSKCRHFQFECRNNSECIAIYNVCDGIPQCSDGSDEAVELECHKSRLNALKGPGAEQESVTRPGESAKPVNVQKAIPGQLNTYSGSSSLFSGKSQADASVNDQGKSNYPSGYVNYNYARSPNDKAVEDNLLYNRAQLGTDYSANNGYGLSSWNQYSLPGDGFKPDKLSYMSEPDQYNAPLKESIYWPSFNYQPSSELQHSNRQQTDLSFSNLPPLSDTRSRSLDMQGQAPQQQGSQPLYNRFFGNSPFSAKADSAPNGTAPKELPKAGDLSSESKSQNGSQSKVDYSHLSSNEKQVPVMAPNVVAISYLRDTSPQNGRETNSAVIALTLGLFVTSILVVIVGCRMKSFKKRIARRGRSLAHDADYLVNGMYL